jgi:hypothetical protein
MKTYKDLLEDKEDTFNDEIYELLPKKKVKGKDSKEREYIKRDNSLA